jgi:purine-binding chemotaxis protein CheW
MMNDTAPDNAPLFDLSSLNLQNLPDSFSPNETAEKPDGEKFVVFFLDDELFALAADQIAEIVRPLEFTPLPNSPAWLHGIANLRGQIISVLNLAKICQKDSAPVSSKSKLIVLKPVNCTSSMAFPVDRLSEIITIAKKDILPAEDFRFLGTARHEMVSVKLLDTVKLFSSLL